MHARLSRLCLLVLFAACLPGCGLFVAAGKMIWGDPVLPSPFTAQTDVRLHKDDVRVLVYCSTPESLKVDMSSLHLDLAELASREMKRKGVSVVPGREVSRYLEESIGIWGTPDEIAQHFEDVDVILHFDLERFDFEEPNSPNLFRGNVHGMLHAYAVREIGDRRRASPVFNREFTSVYPKHNPIPADRMTPELFLAQLKQRIASQLAQVFVDHRASELVY